MSSDRGRDLLAVLLVCFCLTLVHAPATAAVRAGPTPTQLIAALERADKSVMPLFDMHGNANDELQQLMVLRFDATSAVMQSIDRMEGDPKRDELVASLYDVLGFVKDPASIGWLRGKLREGHADAFYRDYLPKWRAPYSGFAYGSWEWLTGQDAWISFWRDALEAERDPERRIEILCVLCQFDDASVVSFFVARRAAATEPREVLLVESYLDGHDRPADDKRVQWAVDALAPSAKNRDFLVSMAGGLRHEAFVPFLVSVVDYVDPNTTPAYYPAERALQPITFECDRHGKAAWREWYAAHGKEGRRHWVQHAVDAFHEQMTRNLSDAAKRFDDDLIYCWNEISLLPFVQSELLPHPEFHDAIGGWINLTYTDFYRERLRPLAEQASKSGHMGEISTRDMQERGYLRGGRKRTWAETVEIANQRV